MPSYAQADRPLIIRTPLAADAFLLTGFRGHEAISELFSFQLGLLADAESQIRFDRILGKNVTVEMRLTNGARRFSTG